MNKRSTSADKDGGGEVLYQRKGMLITDGAAVS